jgi:CRP-like cAMP-binding protein/membrane protein YdbS with pleckstrin-like domain
VTLIPPVPLDPKEVVGHLAGADIFSVLEPDELALLAPLFLSADYRPGQVITSEGNVDATLWLVVEGMVSIDVRADDGTVQQLAFGGYGTVIGVHGVLTGVPRPSNVVVVEPTRMLHAEREGLWGVFDANPGLLDRLVLPDAVRSHLELSDVTRPEEGEFQVGLYRRHPIALAEGIALPVFLLLGGLATAGALATLTSVLEQPHPLVVLALAILGLVIPGVVAVWAFYDYWGDYLLVTNHRIIEVEQKPFISVSRREAAMVRVQDVIVIVPDPLARAVGYGTLVIQTASTHGRMKFTKVASPERVQQAIQAQVDHARDEEHRERQSWVESKVRMAMGDVDTGEAATVVVTSAAPAPDRTVAARSAVLEVAAWVIGEATRRLGYLWPRTREVEGDVITWRKHWWFLVRKAWVPLSFLAGTNVIALLALVFGARGWWVLPIATWPIAVPWLWWQYEDWRNDLYRVTREHVIDIERLPLGLRQEKRQAALDRVQDVRYTVPGPWAFLLNYGDVIIETAAEMGNFTFIHVARPAEVHAVIVERIETYRAEHARKDREGHAEEWVHWLAAYHRLAGESAGPGTPPVPGPDRPGP